MSFLENAKALFELAKKAGNIDLQQAIISLQQEALELQEENRLLKTENARLTEQLAFHGTLIFEDNRYWSERDGNREGPYCSRCWDADRRMVRLHDYENGFLGCPACETAVRGGSSPDQFGDPIHRRRGPTW